MKTKKHQTDFEVKISKSTNLKTVVAKLKEGYLTQFLVTTNLEIFVTNKAHRDAMRKDGLNNKDILAQGVFELQNGVVRTDYLTNCPEKGRGEIYAALLNFVDEYVGK